MLVHLTYFIQPAFSFRLETKRCLPTFFSPTKSAWIPWVLGNLSEQFQGRETWHDMMSNWFKFATHQKSPGYCQTPWKSDPWRNRCSCRSGLFHSSSEGQCGGSPWTAGNVSIIERFMILHDWIKSVCFFKVVLVLVTSLVRCNLPLLYDFQYANLFYGWSICYIPMQESHLDKDNPAAKSSV